MNRLVQTAALVAALAAAAVLGPAARAEIVYDNTVNSQGYAYTPLAELGDAVYLDGTARIVTAFKVLLYSSDPDLVTIDLESRFYANDGPGDEPGTLLWSDVLWGLDVLPGTQTVDFAVPSVVVPDVLTWTVNTGSGTVGPVMYDPPVVGASDDYFWMNDGTGWGAWWFGGYPVANFGAMIEAVPEPATLCLLGAGLAGVAVGRLRRNRK
ncbi:MAG: PEP-CTERM sorting domain-containing protein [Planctomycetes bacterium]|nr:PEP-CTERM sorting domain-containing protein [Planctomycetota bacterium]